MAGRGFLKARLAQLAAQQSSEEQPKPEQPPPSGELSKSEEQPKAEEVTKSQDDNILNVQIPVVGDQFLISGQQQIIGGRRVIITIIMNYFIDNFVSIKSATEV